MSLMTATRRAWACMTGSAFLLGIVPFCASPETSFPDNGIPAFLQPMPQFNHAEPRIAAVHIPDELQIFLGMLVRMGCTGAWTGGRGTPEFRPGVDSRSRYRSSFCCISGLLG